MGCRCIKALKPSDTIPLKPAEGGDGLDGGGGGSGETTTQPTTPSNQPVSRDDYNDKHQGSRNTGHNLPEPPPVPDPTGDFKTEAEQQVLKVINVDLKIAENAKAHHTDRYELTQVRTVATPTSGENAEDKKDEPAVAEQCLVIRRGEPFDISITFDRPFDSQKDDIKLIFDFGENPRESRRTRIVLLLSEEDEPQKWGAKVIDQTGETFAIRIYTPPDLAVSRWKFSFDTVLRLDESCQVFRYAHNVPIYVLFNPWCYDDQVCLNDEKWRNEYVLNDVGRVYYGTRLQIGSKPWNFGQFEDFVLDVSMYLLDKSGLNLSLRGNPIHIVRKISAMVNSPDDNGVLVGNWSGDYSDGTSPVAWNGSVAILEEFWKAHEPVKYGQCWVFSAVVTTICRSLGIPCRSVTNFVSAHDTDGSLTIDEYWDAEGKPLNEYNQDSVWNFHVWNDVWMARPDLPDGFGGWQVIDATPQETSEGVYCTGPASVEAIKNGLVQLPYDGPFIFSEVNADRVHCILTKDGTWTHTFQANYIGKNISTKGPDGDERLDITSLYKFAEGSQQERTAVWRAVAISSTNKSLYKVEAEDIKFEMVHLDDTLVGQPFDVVLKVTNNSDQSRTVKTTLSSAVVHYTGVPVASIKSESISVEIKPKTEEHVRMTVDVDDYLNRVTDMCHIKISSMSQVEQTKQFYCDSDDFRLSKPSINVEVSPQLRVNQECEVVASFTNPLPRMLTNCEFTFEAPSFKRPEKVSHKNVPSKGVAKCSLKLTPPKDGAKEIIVGFWSKQLSGLTGSAKVTVVPSTPQLSNGRTTTQ